MFRFKIKLTSWGVFVVFFFAFAIILKLLTGEDLVQEQLERGREAERQRQDEKWTGEMEIISIKDWNYFEIDIDGTPTIVRLNGVELPREGTEEEYENCVGTVTEYVKSLIDGKTVRLEYDQYAKEHNDSDGNILAYVYLSDTREMIQELLISNGYAKAVNIEQKTSEYTNFKIQQNMAEGFEKGFWADIWKAEQ